MIMVWVIVNIRYCCWCWLYWCSVGGTSGTRAGNGGAQSVQSATIGVNAIGPSGGAAQTQSRADSPGWTLCRMKVVMVLSCMFYLHGSQVSELLSTQRIQVPDHQQKPILLPSLAAPKAQSLFLAQLIAKRKLERAMVEWSSWASSFMKPKGSTVLDTRDPCLNSETNNGMHFLANIGWLINKGKLSPD